MNDTYDIDSENLDSQFVPAATFDELADDFERLTETNETQDILIEELLDANENLEAENDELRQEADALYNVLLLIGRL